MRKMSELTAEDFPGVDQGKFEEWKKMRISTDKKILATVGVMFILFIVNIIMLSNRIFGNEINNYLYVFCIILIVYMIVILFISRKTLKLQKSLGITKRSMREALNK
jgi:hypothetical protein